MWFVLGEILLEIEIDTREQAAFALVSCWTPSGAPSGYYVDTKGRRVRWHLAEILSAIGEPADAASLRLATKRSGPAAIEQQLALIATLTLSHLQALQADICARSGKVVP